MKLIINTCSGGFGLSHKGMMRYAELKGITLYPEKGIFGDYCNYYIVPKGDRVTDLSDVEWEALNREQRIAYLKKLNEEVFNVREIARDDPALVRVVEEMGVKANGRFSSLRVVEIPDDVQWRIIDDHHCGEHIAEKHRTWY